MKHTHAIGKKLVHVEKRKLTFSEEGYSVVAQLENNLNKTSLNNDKLNKDIATLESLHSEMTKTLAFGGLDKTSASFVGVLLKDVTNRYGLPTDSISVENLQHGGLVVTTVSMEKVSETLGKFATASKKMLKEIWKKILEFARWIKGFFINDVKKSEHRAEAKKDMVNELLMLGKAIDSDSVKKDKIVVKDGKEYVATAKVARATKPVQEEPTSDTPKNEDIYTVTKFLHESPGELTGRLIPGATYLPKETIRQMVRNITGRTVTNLQFPYGTVFGTFRNQKAGYLVTSRIYWFYAYNQELRRTIHKALSHAIKTLEYCYSEPDYTIAPGNGVKVAHNAKYVGSYVDRIYEHSMFQEDGKYNEAFGGLTPVSRPKYDANATPDSIKDYYPSSEFKFSFTKPEIANSFLGVDIVSGFERLLNDKIEISKDNVKINAEYDRMINIKMDKYLAVEDNADIDWCINWITALARFSGQLDSYMMFYDKYIEKYVDDSYSRMLYYQH